MKKKLTIIGRGVDPARHLSLAAIRTLQASDKVIGIEPEAETWSALRAEFELPEIDDVSRLYQNGSTDLENYDRFLQHALALTHEHSRVALLVAGHPRLGVTFLQLLNRIKPGDLEIEVIEGISSFDVIINDLSLDPLERGTALLDANRLLLFRYQLEPALAYFIYHVCSVGNPRTDYLRCDQGNRLGLLRDYLLRFYPAEKELILCKASNGIHEKSRLVRIPLAELADHAEEIDFGTTLHIPSDRPVRMDREYLELLRTAR